MENLELTLTQNYNIKNLNSEIEIFIHLYNEDIFINTCKYVHYYRLFTNKELVKIVMTLTKYLSDEKNKDLPTIDELEILTINNVAYLGKKLLCERLKNIFDLIRENNVNSDLDDFDTKNLVARYLEPAKITNFNKMYKLINSLNNNEFEIKIKEMNYSQFLLTGYWNAIRSQKKKIENGCQNCGSHKNLEVHHLTYINHGNEHNHLDDLKVLCTECHAKEHNKKTIYKFNKQVA